MFKLERLSFTINAEISVVNFLLIYTIYPQANGSDPSGV